jgi:hypothetical protein
MALSSRAARGNSWRNPPKVLALLLLVIAGPARVLGAASCFPGGDTSELACCTGAALEIDTDAGTIKSPPSGAGVITVSATGGNAPSGSGYHGDREFTFDNILLSDVTVTLKGSRALRLVSNGGISMSKVTLDASPDKGTITFSSCSGVKSLDMWHLAKLGGFNGGSRESSGSTYTSATSSDGAARNGNCGKTTCARAGGAGGSHGGKGGMHGSEKFNMNPQSGTTYLPAANDLLVGGGGGGGGGDTSDSDNNPIKCISRNGAPGGAGGGAMEFQAKAGDIWIDSDVVIKADGGDTVYPLYGGAGAGGRLRFTTAPGYAVKAVSGALLAARGGYVDPIRTDSDLDRDCNSDLDPCYEGMVTNGGGGIISFMVSASGSMRVMASSSILDVRGGTYRCPGSGCGSCPLCVQASDGSIVYGLGGDVVLDPTTAPADLSSAEPNPYTVCHTMRGKQLAPTPGSGLLEPAGGNVITVQVAMPVAEANRRINTQVAPTIKVGTFTCSSTSWTDVFGTATAAVKATASCTSSPPGVGTSLDLVVTFTGTLATETLTLSQALSFKPPTVSGWSAPAVALRFAAAGTTGVSYTVQITGTGFGSSANNADMVIKVGGQPCASVNVVSNTVVDCGVPSNVGTGHAVTVSAGGQAASGTMPLFSYAPPEIHLVKEPLIYSAVTGSSWDSAGGETVEIRGFNFGDKFWNGAAAVTASAANTNAAVMVGTASCTNVAVVSDRRITCTLPAYGGRGRTIIVTIGGQTVTSLTTNDGRSAVKAATGESDSAVHMGAVPGFLSTRLLDYSSPTVSTITVVDSSATTSNSGGSNILPIATSGGTVTITGQYFGSNGAPTPTVWWDGVQLTGGISRTSDTSMSVVIPAGIGVGHILALKPNLPADPAPSDAWFAVNFIAPTYSALSQYSDLPQAGGGQLTISGSNFGPPGSPAPTVYIGGTRTCASPTRGAGSLAHVQLTCTVPSGVGKSVPVIVSVGGQNSSATKMFDFSQPDIQSISPSYAFTSSTKTWDVEITGVNLGAEPSHIASITIANAPCPAGSILWHSSTRVSCTSLPGNALLTTVTAVSLFTGNYEAARDVTFTAIGAPVFNIDSAFSSGPTDGNSTMKLIPSLSSFGFSINDIVSVDLGTSDPGNTANYLAKYPCHDLALSSGSLSCIVTGGVGSNMHVRVVTKGLRANAFVAPGNRLWSFQAPTLDSLSPDLVTYDVAITNYTFDVYGSDFGRPTELPSALSIGGFACPNMVFLNSSHLRCVEMPAPANGAWKATTVSVTVGGQKASAAIFRFAGAPQLSGVNPSTGSVAGGYNITVTGSDLGTSAADVSSLSVGSRECLAVFYVSSSEIKCVVPVGVGSSLAVSFLSSKGVTSQLDGAFSYALPAVTSVSPSYVMVGSRNYNLTLDGVNLATPLDVPEVIIGGSSCSTVEVVSSERVRCLELVASSGFVGSAVVLRHGTVVSVTTQGLITTYGIPVVLALSPASGTTAGGTRVRVVGSNYGRVNSDITQVLIGGRPCTNISVVSDALLEVSAPPGAGKNKIATVITASDKSSAASATYSYFGPTVEGLSPTMVLTGPLKTYTFGIFGTDFGTPLDVPRASDVRVGGRQCDSVSFVNHTYFECNDVSAASGWSSTDVSVILASQSGTGFGLLHSMPAPVVTAVSPAVVAARGGDTISISGRGFGFSSADIAGVSIGGRPCQSFSLVSSAGTSISCVTPAGIGSSINVKVTSVAGSSSGDTPILSYDKPQIFSIVPSYALTGSSQYGYNFSIRGTNFGTDPRDVVSSVLVGGTACGSLVRINDTDIECTLVPATTWLSQDVRVTVGGQTDVDAAIFQAFSQARVVAVAPASLDQSSFSGGSRRIVITGTGFGRFSSDVVSVAVGTAACIDHDLIDASSLACTVLNGTGEGVRVSVRNAAGGISLENAAFSFARPTLASLSPKYAMTGASLTESFEIIGANFGLGLADIESISIGGVACANILWINPGRLRCLNVPAKEWASRSVNVKVRQYALASASLLTVYGAPRVTGVIPSSGPTSGMTSSGRLFLSIACSGCGEAPGDVVSASIGGKPCTSVQFLPQANEVRCGLPSGSGAGKSVSVVLRGGETSVPNSFFSYYAPLIFDVVPASMLQGSNVYNVTLLGRYFGDSLPQISVDLGGTVCSKLSGLGLDPVTNYDMVTCEGVQPSSFSTVTSVREAATINVGAQKYVLPSIMKIAPAPSITTLSPTAGSTKGGYNVTISGPFFSFGFQAADVVGVTVGAVTVPTNDIFWQSGTDVVFTMPAGTGASHAVRVSRADGLVTPAAVTFSYSSPVILSASPNELLTGDSVYNITVVGSQFGSDISKVLVRLGGVQCEAIRSLKVHNEDLGEDSVVCVNVAPLRFSADPNARISAAITVAGQQSPGKPVFTIAPVPTVLSVTPSIGSTLGGFNVTLECPTYAVGFSPADLVLVTVGSRTVPMNKTYWISPSQLVFEAPPGVGTSHVVKFTRKDSQTSSSSRTLSYFAPTVAGASPNELLSGSTMARYNITVTGTGFGTDVQLVQMELGGAPCEKVVLHSTTQVECLEVSPSAFSPVQPTRSRVLVRVAGQSGQLDSGLTVFDRPVVKVVAVDNGVHPGVLGGYPVSVEGTGFGFVQADVSHVTVGSYRIEGPDLLSFSRASDATSLQVSPPPGIGSSLPVVVHRRDGVASTGTSNSYFSFALPVVSSSSPSYLMPGPTNYTINMTGTDLASKQDDILSVSVGKSRCGAFELVSPQLLRCMDLPWTSGSIPVVEIARIDTTHSFSGVVQGVSDVGLQRAEPAVVASGTRTKVILFGAGFGRVLSDVASLTVGGILVPVETLTESQITFFAPNGAGSGLEVVVTTARGSVARSNLLSYYPPSIASVTPLYAYVGQEGVMLTLNGTGFGTMSTHVEAITLAAGFGSSRVVVPCTLVASTFSPSQLSCQLQPLPRVSGMAVIEITVGGQVSRDTGTLRIIGIPLVSFVVPSSDSTRGGQELIVSGASLGEVRTEVLNTTIGGKHAALVEYTSSTSLTLRIPPGVGGGLSIMICTIAGCSVPNQLFSYNRPSVTELLPPSAISGRALEDFWIRGENFGNSPLDVGAVTIGGSPCGSVVWWNDSAIECRAVSGEFFSNNRKVIVTIGGQQSLLNAAFQPIGTPVIRLLAPAVASEGDSILLFGDNFGRSIHDIKNITIHGSPCRSMEYLSGVAVRCTVPSIPADLRRIVAVEGRTEVLRGLSVQLTTIGGLVNPPNALFAYSGSGVPPVNPAFAVAGFRTVSSTSTVSLRWFFRNKPDSLVQMRESELEFVEVVDSFDVEWSNILSNITDTIERATRISDTSVTGGTDGEVTVKLATLTLQAMNPEEVEPATIRPVIEQFHWDKHANTNQTLIDLSSTGFNWFSTELNGYEKYPYIFRVRGRSPSGVGPWSGWSDPVYQACSESELLALHYKNPADQICEKCPSDYAFCAGRGIDVVVAKQGYWRIPIQGKGIGFAKCPRPLSCLGWTEEMLAQFFESQRSQGNQSVVARLGDARSLAVTSSLVPEKDPSQTSSDLVPYSYPGLQLDPKEVEGCATGYEGILCSSCIYGYARSGPFTCSACAPPWQLGVLLAVAICVVFGVVSFVISRALKQKGSSTKPEIQLIKVILTAMQQVGIAASFDLRWPSAVVELFKGVDSMSSVSSDALSIDCMTPQRMQVGNFFLKSLIVILSPFIIVGTLSVFWIGRWWCRSRLCPKRDKKPKASKPSGRRFCSCPRSAAATSEASASPVAASPKPVESNMLTMPAEIRRLQGKHVEAADKVKRTERAANIVKRIDKSKLRRALLEAARKTVNERRAKLGLPPIQRNPTIADVALAALRKSATWFHTRDRLIVSTFVVLFMIHTTVTRAALKLFTCRNLRDLTGRGEAASRSVLAADMTLACDAPESVAWKMLAGIPTFLFFSCGIPLLAFWALHRNREKLNDARVKQVYGFLYAGFNPKVYFWESVIMMRKVGLSVVSVFLEPAGIDIQAYVALFVLFVAAVLHARYWPYELASVNFLEMSSLVAGFATICMGLFTLSPNATPFVQVVATVGIFGVQVVFFGAAATLLISTTLSSMKRDSSTSLLSRASKVLINFSRSKRQVLKNPIGGDMQLLAESIDSPKRQSLKPEVKDEPPTASAPASVPPPPPPMLMTTSQSNLLVLPPPGSVASPLVAAGALEAPGAVAKRAIASRTPKMARASSIPKRIDLRGDD